MECTKRINSVDSEVRGAVNMSIKVSIVVPIYKVEKYLHECVDSILTQTYRNLEVILVDDGSPDLCPEICDEYASKDKRVVVVHKANGGLTSARKAGICRATGDYVLYVDGDDWIATDYLERMLAPLAQARLDAVVNIATYMNYEDGRQLERSTSMTKGIYKGADIVREVYPHYICEDKFYDTSLSTNLCLYLFKREFLIDIQMQVEDEIAMGEDMALTFRAFLKAEALAVVEHFGYHYRQRADSMLHKRVGNHFQRTNMLYRNLKAAVRDNLDVRRSTAMARKIPRGIFFTLWTAVPVRFASISENFLFPFPEVVTGSRVFVYGMGVVGQGIMEAILENRKYELVGCSDQGWKKHSGGMKKNDGIICKVYAPEKIQYCNFDYVVIGVSRHGFRRQITEYLIELGVPCEKIAKLDQSLLTETNLPF